MVVWFVALSVVLVAVVFQSGAVDYRTVAIGALLPWLDQLFGGPRVLHAVVGAGLVLAVVMLATQRRRLLRRRVLGIPIGMLCHLVLDGSFVSTRAFWWPVTGWTWPDGPVPELAHLPVSLLLEAAGFAAAWWAWNHFGLSSPVRRERFLRSGRLEVA